MYVISQKIGKPNNLNSIWEEVNQWAKIGYG